MSNNNEQGKFTNGWSTWKHHVLNELKRIDTSVKENSTESMQNYMRLRAEMEQIRLEVARLQIKSGLWGAISGAIPAVIYYYITSKGG